MNRTGQKMRRASVAATLALPWMLLAFAGATEAASAKVGAQPVITPAGSLLQVLAGLVIVLLLLAAVIWLLRRMGTLHQHGPGAMRVLGAVAVGQRERVVLIEVAQTWLVVGVAPGSVNPLHSMPKSAEAIAQPPITPPAPPFASWLQRFVDRDRRAP